MRRLFLTLSALLLALPALAQDASDLNLQVHGYATQGFVYSTGNNWDTLPSSGGSAAWTDAVVNLTAQPTSRLRIGVQARYNLFGDAGEAVTIDWAQGDYKLNDRFGVRFGKVKTPSGIFNETQDVDPAFLWILLPQSIYPLASRNATLAHLGAVIYGTLPLGETAGRLEYRVYGGARILASNDGYLQAFRDQGIELPEGVTSPVRGGSLRWRTPLTGLLFGAAAESDQPSGPVTAQFGSATLSGTLTSKVFIRTNYFASYEHGRAAFVAEYSRLPAALSLDFPGLPSSPYRTDDRAFYLMTSYKVTARLSAGAYYSSSLDRQAAYTSSRYQKDWTFSARYDVNPYLYFKAEQHLLRGTSIGFNSSDNPGGLQPDTRMSLLKLGVTF